MLLVWAVVQVTCTSQRRRLGMLVVGFVVRGGILLFEKGFHGFVKTVWRPYYRGHGYGVGSKEWMILGRASIVMGWRLLYALRRYALSVQLYDVIISRAG